VKLGTRLLLALLPTVALVMLLYTWWALKQREAVIVSEARRETEAYATALALAVEHAFEDLGAGGLQGIIDEVSRQSKIYGILVYGRDGHPLLVSAPLQAPVWGYGEGALERYISDHLCVTGGDLRGMRCPDRDT
jgi:hypothetical protein